GWRRVRGGITLVLIALFIACVMGVLGLFGLLIAVAGGGSPALVMTYLCLALLGSVADIVKTVGFGFCAAAPPQSGAEGLGISSFVLAIANAVVTPVLVGIALLGGVLAIGQAALSDGAAAAGSARATGLLIAVLGGLSFLLVVANPLVFLLFLRAAALALR